MSVVVCNRGGKIDGAKWEVGLGPGDTAAPTFRPMSIVAKWLDGLRCHLVRRRASAEGFGPGHIVLDGDPDPLPKRAQHRPRPPPKKGHIPQFSAHVCCVKRQDGSRCHLVRRKLSPGHIVLDGDAASSRKGHSSPSLFSAYAYFGQTDAHLLLRPCIMVAPKPRFFQLCSLSYTTAVCH